MDVGMVTYRCTVQDKAQKIENDKAKQHKPNSQGSSFFKEKQAAVPWVGFEPTAF